MKRLMICSVLIILMFLMLTSCGLLGTYNIEEKGIPQFVNNDYIELSTIQRISRFRSSAGHDYSDDFESCCSMKHYYQPYDSLVWNDIEITSPVKGKITRIREEWAGTQLLIRSDEYPAFVFIIFH